MKEKKKFNLLPTHKFVLLGAAIIVEETTDNAYRTSALCAATVPEVQAELQENGFITVGQDMIPVLTEKGYRVVQSMLGGNGKVKVPYKLQHFKPVSDGHLLEMPKNTLNAIKERAKNSPIFAEKLFNSEELKSAAANLEFLMQSV